METQKIVGLFIQQRYYIDSFIFAKVDERSCWNKSEGLWDLYGRKKMHLGVVNKKLDTSERGKGHVKKHINKDTASRRGEQRKHKKGRRKEKTGPCSSHNTYRQRICKSRQEERVGKKPQDLGKFRPTMWKHGQENSTVALDKEIVVHLLYRLLHNHKKNEILLFGTTVPTGDYYAQ